MEFPDNVRALMQMLSRKDVRSLAVFLSAKAFSAKIVREG